ncbi:MAG: kelch repeat-containing protein [Smithella sp.]
MKTSNETCTISFTSEPVAGTQNFPGDIITLKWQIPESYNFQLYQAGSSEPLHVDWQKEKERKISLGSSDVNFRLVGYDDNNNPVVEQTLSIKVLQPGWYDKKNTLIKCDSGHPDKTDSHYDLEPTLLVNADNAKLYGLFRFKFKGREWILLFETQNPFGDWIFVPTLFDKKEGYLPEGIATSPGVYHDDKIWLIGGSQIDPDQCSNGVWCLDCLDLTTEEKEWKDRTPTPTPELPHWKSRMGHAVLVFDNKIWLMGGLDEAGNPLNDIWTLDISKEENKWTQLAEADWEPRCLFSTAVFEGKIWIYGGAAAPFSQILYNDLWSATYDSESHKLGKWNKQKGPMPDSAAKAPIASCMQEFKGNLYLFVNFRTLGGETDTVDAMAFHLDTSTSPTWKTIKSDDLKDWGGTTTSSCQLVAYGDRMLIARTLSYEAINTVMKIYVPPLK